MTERSARFEIDRPLVIVDGRRLTGQATGVGRYLSLLLDEWAETYERLPFEPVVVLHEMRDGHPDPWRKVLRHQVAGSWAPGWIWENFALARSPWRDATLFAPANLVPWRWRGPVVLVTHDTFCEHADARIPVAAKLRFRARYRRSAHRADLVLTPSEATASDVRNHFGLPEDRIRVIRPGFRPRTNSAGGSSVDPPMDMIESPYVLFVGKTSARRDFPAIVEAVERIVASGTDLKLIRVGPRTTRPAPSPVLTDLSHVSDGTLDHLYRHAQALIWPSAREGFGLPVLEAMAHGCPVITRPVNALGELCQGACVSLPDAEPVSIARAIQSVLNDPSLRSNLVRAGLERARSFDARGFAEEVAGAIATVACHSSSHQRGGTTGLNRGRGRRAVITQHWARSCQPNATMQSR